VGSTARVLPAATLASVAAAALVLAVDGGGAAAPVEVRAYKMQALVENAASRVVDDVRLEPGGAVRHLLVTVVRTPCGTTTERRYEMLWYLDRSGRTFTARDLVGVQLAGVDPALACG
jgi:hypothetical protein